jgi:N-acetyl-anhydromuramyl-L-alanine amidase AmpD
VIIHTVQGSWSSAINWFNDSRAGVSAHYTVRSNDGHIGQSLEEKDIGYHAGNWTHNQTSVGIEHEGFISDPSWYTAAMYRSSARLTAYLCRKYRIPVDRNHIFGHNEVPGCSGSGGGAGCHVDPGRHWDWARYMRLVRSFGNYQQVVDNANGRRFRSSNAWSTSSWSSQRYGRNYAYARPAAVNDPARFKINIPRRGRYRFWAWWPANSGYNNRTLFLINTAGGVRRVRRSQRRNGGRWVLLGTWVMHRGDRWCVRIPRRNGGRGYVIADAIMVRSV